MILQLTHRMSTMNNGQLVSIVVVCAIALVIIFLVVSLAGRGK